MHRIPKIFRVSCSLANAAAIVPIVSLEWCTALLHAAEEIKTDRA
jgi:hypothetical protein